MIRASQFQTKIRHLEEVDVVTKIEIALSSLYITLGFSKPPEQIEVIAVAQSLKKYHSMLTVEEIIVALEMNVAGLLGETIQHYQLFSVEYVTSVFNKFLDHKYEVMKKFTQDLSHARKLEEPKKATPEQAYKFILNYVKENNQVPITADWSAAFDWMWSQKMLDVEQLKEFMNAEKPKYEASCKMKLATAATELERRIILDELSEGAISYHLRKKYLTEYQFTNHN